MVDRQSKCRIEITYQEVERLPSISRAGSKASSQVLSPDNPQKVNRAVGARLHWMTGNQVQLISNFHPLASRAASKKCQCVVVPKICHENWKTSIKSQRSNPSRNLIQEYLNQLGVYQSVKVWCNLKRSFQRLLLQNQVENRRICQEWSWDLLQIETTAFMRDCMR